MSAMKDPPPARGVPPPPAPGKAIGRLFAKPDFDANSFALNVLKNGRDEVDGVARVAQFEMSQAEQQLHEVVFASEGLSVAASRQLRAAQADVCLLSSRLSEQRSEIGKMMAAPLFSSEAAAQPTRRDSDQTAAGGGGGLLAEKVEGCGFLGDSPGRGLIFDGHMMELEPNPPNQPLRRIHMYLLTDCIVTAIVPPHHPRAAVRNRFDRLFPLDQVAVTAAPPPAPSTRLRLLSFPEARVFEVENPGLRTAWLHQIDIAKKSRSRNRTQQDVDSSKSPPKSDSVMPEAPLKPPEWLQEALDELDVYVAERDLESAVDALLSIRKEWKQSGAISSENQPHAEGIFADSRATAASNRLRQRQSELVFLLFRELDTSVTRGAFLDARQAVALLCRIDKANEATHRLLGHGTTILKARVLQQANSVGGGTVGALSMPLSRQLAENMANTGFSIIADFVEVLRGALASCGFGTPLLSAAAVEEKTNENNSIRIVNARTLASCTAALTAWVGQQTTWLTSQVHNQSEQQQGLNLQTLADCAEILRRAINSQPVFGGVGLDLWPIVELMLVPHTTAAVKQAQAVLIESIKKHLVLSVGGLATLSPGKQPINTLPSAVAAKIGQEALVKHFANCPIPPHKTIVHFSDAVLNFSSQICMLYSTMQHTALCRAVTTVLRAAAEQMAASKVPDKGNEEILASFRFLFGPVLEKIMLLFRKVSKLETRDFVVLQKECYGGSPPPLTAPQAHSTPLQRGASPKQQQVTPNTGQQPTQAVQSADQNQIRRPQAQTSQSHSAGRQQRGVDTGRPPTPKKNPNDYV